MDGWTIGTDVATMVGSLSVLTATATWVGGRWMAWRRERAATRLRNWHGYLMPEARAAWHVRTVDDASQPPGRVVLDVLDLPDGKPDAMIAEGMRRTVKTAGMLSEPPSPEEFDFLKALRRERGYGKGGFPVR